MSIKIDTAIFRDYDIRGTYPDQLNEDTFYILGRAIASYLNVDKIGVGHDMRLSSPSLFRSLTQGIMEQGADVVNLGMISTEMHYFASGYHKMPANIIISASHNPANYNGLKIVKEGVVPLHGGFGLPEIKDLALKQNFSEPAKKGSIENLSLINDWILHALSFINYSSLRPLKVVIDAGNGMGGVAWSNLSNTLPISIIPMYFEPDGHFPHHLPDPINEKNSIDLKDKIIRVKAYMGIAFDGDADRFFAFDENGKMISGTVTSAIITTALLEKLGPDTVLYNSVCGRIIPEIIQKYKGRPLRVRVGHSYIKETMKKENALFAGEHSGHFYFRDNYFADSSLIAGLIFLEYVSKRNLLLSKIVQEFDKYPTSGEINFRVSLTEDVLKNIEKMFPQAIKTDKLDGLSVWFSDWWFNLRASKTEPLLRLNLEADNADILNTQLVNLINLIKGFGGIRI